jgi:hypothetical protein
MEAAKFFGSNADTWVALFMGTLALIAVIVIAKQKRRRWAELGDDEEALPHDTYVGSALPHDISESVPPKQASNVQRQEGPEGAKQVR